MTGVRAGAPPGESSPRLSRLLSDERLARRAASGDERALEAIYRRYHQGLYRFCLAMTGNAADAQDALQNTMVKVLRALPGERREIKLKPWLHRIARNEAIELVRRRRDGDRLEPELPTAGTVAETAETRDRLRSLLGDLEQLPERQRTVLLMRELSGCDFAEIGAALETSAAVARQTLYEARLGLRELAEGRELRCADVRRELSDGDGRVLRRRRTRAHLRACPECRTFQEAIAERERALAGLAPLPLATSAGLLHTVLGGQASAAIAGSVLAKSAVTLMVTAAVGVTVADRAGLIELPAGGKHEVAGQAQPGAPAGQGHAGGGGNAADTAGREAGARQRSERTPVRAEARRAEGARSPDIGEAAPTIPVGHGARPPDRPTTTTETAGAGPDGGGSTSGQAGDGRSRAPDPTVSTSVPGGGGPGPAASGERGRPEVLPAAANQGQETAAERKPPHAGNPPGHEDSPGKGKPVDTGNPDPRPPGEDSSPGRSGESQREGKGHDGRD